MTVYLAAVAFQCSSEGQNKYQAESQAELLVGAKTPSFSTMPSELPPALRRRASPLTKAIAESYFQVCRQAGLTSTSPSIVLATDLGEISTTVQLLRRMANGDAMSPTGFHNSVHNTATGYISIATENHESSTTIVAGASGFAMALLEATMQIECGQEHVVVIVADEELPPPIKEDSNGGIQVVAFALLNSVPESRVWITLNQQSPSASSSSLVSDTRNCDDHPSREHQQVGLVAVQQALTCAQRFEQNQYGRQTIGGFSNSDLQWWVETGKAGLEE